MKVPLTKGEHMGHYRICMSRVIALTLCFWSSLAFAADGATPPKLSDKEREERQEIIQLMNERLIHKKPQFSMVGPLVSVGGNAYSIYGETFVVNRDTKIQGEMRSGVSAEVRGFVVSGKEKLAEQITIIEGGSHVEAASSSNQISDLSRINPRGSR